MRSRYRAHVFVCTNERPQGHPRGCCKSKGSEEILKALKEGVTRRGIKSGVRVQRAGCLDACEEGVSVVIYPQETWLKKVTLADVDKIIDDYLDENQLKSPQ